MTRLRSVGDYEREMTQLDGLIQQQRSAEGEVGDFASRLGLYSLEARMATLQSELASLRDEQMVGHEIDVIFAGKPVLWHMLDVDFMGNMLVKIQGLVRAMVASERGREQRTGRFPKKVVDLSRLRFVGSFAGSFGMKLETFQDQPELDGFIPLSPTFDSLLSLLQAADDTDKLLSQLSELSMRTRLQYQDFVHDLCNAEADVRVVWPTTSGNREASLRHSQAVRLLGTLQEVREETDGRWYTGVLDQASKRYGRFGITTDAGDVFDGVVEAELLDTVRNYYDRRCRAYILTTEVVHQRTGTVKQSHRLQELEDIAITDGAEVVRQD